MKYFNLFTQVGLEKIAAAILSGEQIKVTQMAVGDGGGGYYEPTADMTELRREVWRGDTTFEVDPTDATHLKAVMLLPGTVGGFVIREYAIFDEAGDMLAISNTADIAKAVAAEGMSTDVRLVMNLFLTGDEAQVITYDPTVIIATKEDVAAVDGKRQLHEADGAKHVSVAEKALWNAKVDRVAGKGLSANDYTDSDKAEVGKIAGLSNPNLFINGDFNIWQRGESFVYPVDIYIADRWWGGIVYNGMILKVDDGLLADGGGVHLRQYLEPSTSKFLKDKTVTTSYAMTFDGVTNVITNTFVYDGSPYIELCYHHFSGTPRTIHWAKLELGTVATPFVPRAYGEELALCQRYYVKGYAAGQAFIATKAFVQNQYSAIIPVPLQLRSPFMIANIAEQIENEINNTFVVAIPHPGNMEHGYTFAVTEIGKYFGVAAVRNTATTGDIKSIVSVKGFDLDAEIY